MSADGDVDFDVSDDVERVTQELSPLDEDWGQVQRR